MKRLLLILFLLYLYVFAYSQKVDKVITTDAYKSYYSYDVMCPLYVTYSLYKGGGPCKRDGMSFRKCDEKCASNADYTDTDYERGHLANAEDFAFDCELEKQTFCYYNCVPQTTEGNHRNWLDWEFKIRELSQRKKIFIVAGAIYGGRKVTKPGSKVRVPNYCYKIVIDPKTNKTLHCLLFKNDHSGSFRTLPLKELKRILGYDLLPEDQLNL